MSNYNIGSVTFTSAELRGVDLKLLNMDSSAGVNFTDREIIILRSIIQKEARPAEVGSTGYFDSTSIVNGSSVIGAILGSVEPGMCWISLLLMLPNFLKLSIPSALASINELKLSLGNEPLGSDVLVSLVSLESSLSNPGDGGPPPDSIDRFNYRHLETVSNMTDKSEVRFNFQELRGLIHVEFRGFCQCKDVLCDHGWSSRFIFQAIMREGCRVGSDIDFSALFGEIALENEAIHSSDGVSTILPKRMDPIMESQLDADMVGMMDKHLDRRTEMLERLVAKLVESDGNKGKQRAALREEEESGEEGTLGPGDSSSVLDRYRDGRSFMRSGTVLQFSKAKTGQQVLDTDGSLVVCKDVVKGFLKTRQLARAEKESVEKVYTINGLAAPFKNGRLNFLCHFHTALSECSIDPEVDPIDALISLGATRAKNPTGELIKQTIERTFDFEEMHICANPFRLPFIEVGMSITESTILKLLDLLQSEYRTAWFEELKCLKIPGFHSDFSTLSTSVREQPSSRPQKRADRRGSVSSSTSSSSSNAASVRQRRRPQRTLLTFLQT
jgi:hypothetical protein